MKFCILPNTQLTFGLDCLDLLQQSLIFTINLDISHLLESDLLWSLIQELEFLWTIFADSALEIAELRLMNFPGAFDFLVEAELVADRYGSKHSLLNGKINRMLGLEGEDQPINSQIKIDCHQRTSQAHLPSLRSLLHIQLSCKSVYLAYFYTNLSSFIQHHQLRLPTDSLPFPHLDLFTKVQLIRLFLEKSREGSPPK